MQYGYADWAPTQAYFAFATQVRYARTPAQSATDVLIGGLLQRKLDFCEYDLDLQMLSWKRHVDLAAGECHRLSIGKFWYLGIFARLRWHSDPANSIPAASFTKS